MTTALSLKQVSYSYHTLKQETTALSSITFDVLSGEFVAVVGPSGCGKSTMLHLIAKLLPLSGGTIKIDGTPIEESTDHIGYMLQKDQLLPWRTIYENVTLGLKIQKLKDPEAFDKVDRLLELYGLKDFKASYPSQLSGGMRQRAALIRTLALSPDILLLDEPFSALDYQTRLQVSDDIGSIIKEKKKTALLVTHDLSEAISMADRVIVLSKRPGTVKAIVPIHLTCEKKTPQAARNAVEFKDYFNQLWREIND